MLRSATLRGRRAQLWRNCSTRSHLPVAGGVMPFARHNCSNEGGIPGASVDEGALSYLTPEARARLGIDRMLERAGWVVQSGKQANLAAARGVAVREFVLKAPHGRADYLLFVDRARRRGGRGEEGGRDADRSGVAVGEVPRRAAGLGERRRLTGSCRSTTSRPGSRRGSRTRSIRIRVAARCSGFTVRRRSPAGSASAAPTRSRRRCGTACGTLPDLDVGGLWPAQVARDPESRGVACR